MTAGELQVRRTSRRPSRIVRPKSVLLVVNGNAGGNQKLETAERAISALRSDRVRVETHLTTSIDDLLEIWPSDPERRVVLVGGDGTVHAVANLPGPQPEIALIPAGSANNICRGLGIPLELRAAVALATTGRLRPIDLIEARTADGTYNVVEGISVGFLAQARVRYGGRNSGDRLRAVRAGADALARFHPLDVRVTAGTVREDLRLAQLFVANLPLYAFGLRVAPHADPEDATLDFVGIERTGRAAIVPMLHELRRGTIRRHPGVHLWRARTARIATHGASPIVADSTDLGSGSVDLRVLPAALRLVRP
jgi:diacylglycerol kinase (ATP)